MTTANASTPDTKTLSGRSGPRGSLNGWSRRHLAWLGLLPFLAYSTVFLVVPGISVAVSAFHTQSGRFTTTYVVALWHGQFLAANENSIELAVVTALSGGIVGLLAAYCVITLDRPRWLRSFVTTFSGVAANFAGVPLAFAFVATLGTTGAVTKLLANDLGINLDKLGFSLASVTGLSVVYTYFQVPLMVLLVAPAIDGLRSEWREAASNLGASGMRFWRHVGLPILAPSILGAMVLLFASAFAAYATAVALTSGLVTLVPTMIGSYLSGNVIVDPQMGQALGLDMIVILLAAVSAYLPLQRRASRWSR